MNLIINLLFFVLLFLFRNSIKGIVLVVTSFLLAAKILSIVASLLKIKNCASNPTAREVMLKSVIEQSILLLINILALLLIIFL